MRVLKLEMSGDDVKEWQVFLVRSGYDPGEPDGEFGPRTDLATHEFQRDNGLKADGIVGTATLARAFAAGFNPLEGPDNPDAKGPFWPPKPAKLVPYLTNVERMQRFGPFEYRPDPQPDNPEQIQITGDWERHNIVTVSIPQLKGVTGAPASGNVRFHGKGADELAALWAAWEKENLLSHVLTWAGSFVPRFIRGSRKQLSNHAFGTAFDINPAWNGLNRRPALVGQEGSVRELVQIANEHGFYWGGHFSRQDGMHFELGAKR